MSVGSVGGFAFRPGRPLTLIALALVALFVRLGFWQLDRARQAEDLKTEVDSRARSPTIELNAATTLPPDMRFRRVHVTGRFEPDQQIFLDNQMHEGSAGVRVITPLRVAARETRVLVDRGWIPLGASRERLPQPEVPAGEVEFCTSAGWDDKSQPAFLFNNVSA